MSLSESIAQSKPSFRAAILFAALEIIREHGSWPRTVGEALALTGSGRSQAYAILARLKELAATLYQPVGRPETFPAADTIVEVIKRVRDFLMDHPGVVEGRGERRRYHDSFRCFVLDLIGPDGPGADLTIDQAASAIGVPIGTLKQWLRLGNTSTSPDADASPTSVDISDIDAPEIEVSNPQIATIIDEWKLWKGTFSAFCSHLRENFRVPFGNTVTGSVLHALGLRQRQPRKNQPAPWSRDSFTTFFPGAQWIGDGTTVAISLNNQTLAFNAEAMLDADSNALTGFRVSPHEDEEAVINAYKHGAITTDQQPLALTLDNRPSNHTSGVYEAVAPTLVIPATPGRGEAKAPIEGAFGLFQQTAPPLRVQGDTPRELARSILVLVFTVWALARNGKPRARLGGKSPAEYYQDYLPSQEEIEEANKWLQELLRRAQLARETRARRADPVSRAILDEALDTFHIPDSDHRLSIALARYSREAIIRGIATFNSKIELETVPKHADPGRYLGGIVRNLNDRLELELTAKHLLDLRLRERDLTLKPLQEMEELVRSAVPPEKLPQAFLKLALDAESLISFRFFLNKAKDALTNLPEPARLHLYRHLVRQTAASFHTDKQRREDAIASLSQAVPGYGS